MHAIEVRRLWIIVAKCRLENQARFEDFLIVLGGFKKQARSYPSLSALGPLSGQRC
jgi:hypothetical protein